eukprot:1156195-Pelagomonas_calceolata.AAC.2
MIEGGGCLCAWQQVSAMSTWVQSAGVVEAQEPEGGVVLGGAGIQPDMEIEWIGLAGPVSTKQEGLQPQIWVACNNLHQAAAAALTLTSPLPEASISAACLLHPVFSGLPQLQQQAPIAAMQAGRAPAST